MRGGGQDEAADRTEAERDAVGVRRCRGDHHLVAVREKRALRAIIQPRRVPAVPGEFEQAAALVHAGPGHGAAQRRAVHRQVRQLLCRSPIRLRERWAGDHGAVSLYSQLKIETPPLGGVQVGQHLVFERRNPGRVQRFQRHHPQRDRRRE